MPEAPLSPRGTFTGPGGASSSLFQPTHCASTLPAACVTQSVLFRGCSYSSFLDGDCGYTNHMIMYLTLLVPPGFWVIKVTRHRMKTETLLRRGL